MHSFEALVPTCKTIRHTPEEHNMKFYIPTTTDHVARSTYSEFLHPCLKLYLLTHSLFSEPFLPDGFVFIAVRNDTSTQRFIQTDRRTVLNMDS